MSSSSWIISRSYSIHLCSSMTTMTLSLIFLQLHYLLYSLYNYYLSSVPIVSLHSPELLQFPFPWLSNESSRPLLLRRQFSYSRARIDLQSIHQLSRSQKSLYRQNRNCPWCYIPEFLNGCFSAEWTFLESIYGEFSKNNQFSHSFHRYLTFMCLLPMIAEFLPTNYLACSANRINSPLYPFLQIIAYCVL